MGSILPQAFEITSDHAASCEAALSVLASDPPLLTGGSPFLPDAYFCDYLRASSPWSPERLAPFISKVSTSDYGDWIQAASPLYRGDVALYRTQGGKRILHLEYGGVFGEGCLFLGSGMGGAANRLYQVVRDQQIPHRVTRLDVAIDFDRPGVAADAFATAFRVAEAYKLSIEMQGDWRPDGVRTGGRTLYVGSRKSAYFLRLYEKGLHPDFLLAGRPDWFRIEAEIKPEKPAEKQVVTKRTLAENFCSREWASEIVQAVGGSVVESLSTGREKQRPDLERQVRTLATQYRRTIDALRDLCPSDASVGVYLCSLRDLLEKSQGVHNYDELSDKGSMAIFLATCAN